jgi:YfiH family protein
MTEKNITIGQISITNSSFGHVGVGQPDFRQRFSESFGPEPKHIVWMDQVHSPTVRWVDTMKDDLILPKTDGVLTRQQDVLLITKTADCVPILLWNEKEKVIGALHCGWKGFFAGILESFAKTCHEHELALEDFYAFLGPHLRVQHFEVREDFLQQAPADKKVFVEHHKGKTFYNLTLGVKTFLNSLGLMKIEDHGIDTYSSPEFYSYRRWSQLPPDQKPDHYNTFANCIILT